MSGEKYSQYRLQRERAERLELLQQIGGLHAEAEALRSRAAQTIAGTSEGLRSTFAEEVRQAQQWVDALQLPDVSGLGMDSQLDRLRAVRQQLDGTTSPGRQILRKLTVALTQKADEMGRRLADRLAAVQQTALAHQELIRLWFGQLVVDDIAGRIAEAEGLLAAEQYNELERILSEVDAELTEKGDHARRQEDKHQKRLYLLKALRQTCQEMAFEEVMVPGDPPEDDRGSPMVYKVDTFDRGLITFRLSLEQISTFAEVAENQCFEQFNAVSEYLEENFGIETEFRMADGSPLPHGRQKGEKDEPTGIDRQAGMSGGM